MEQTRRPESKLQTICTYISDLAFQKGPHARLPTIRELCDMCGTSRATLDEALYVLEQQNVLYRKQGSGIFVSPKLYRRSLCILLDSTLLASAGASPFWGILWGLAAQEARRRALVKNEYHSFHMVVEMAEQELFLPEDVVMMIEEGRIHGILALGLNEDASCWLKQQKVPFVAFGMHSPHMVMLDDIAQAELAVQKLVEQGCRKVGLWATSEYSGKSEMVSHWQREPHFASVLAKHQLPFRPALVRDYLSPPLSPQRSGPLPYQEQGYLLAMDIFGDPDASKPDGIFITNDMMTDGVLAAFRVLGVRLGEDVHVATHGNVGAMMSFSHIPGLSVIEFDPTEIARAMFELLDTVLASEVTEDRVVWIRPHIRPSN